MWHRETIHSKIAHSVRQPRTPPNLGDEEAERIRANGAFFRAHCAGYGFIEGFRARGLRVAQQQRRPKQLCGFRLVVGRGVKGSSCRSCDLILCVCVRVWKEHASTRRAKTSKKTEEREAKIEM